MACLAGPPTTPGLGLLHRCLTQFADPAQNVPCKQDHLELTGRTRCTAALRRKSSLDSEMLGHGGPGFARTSAKHGQGQGHAGLAECVRRKDMTPPPPQHAHSLYRAVLVGGAGSAVLAWLHTYRDTRLCVVSCHIVGKSGEGEGSKVAPR